MSFENLLLTFSPFIETLHKLIERNPGTLVFALLDEKVVGSVFKSFVDIDVMKHFFKKLAHRDSMIFCVETYEFCYRPIEPNFHN